MVTFVYGIRTYKYMYFNACLTCIRICMSCCVTSGNLWFAGKRTRSMIPVYKMTSLSNWSFVEVNNKFSALTSMFMEHTYSWVQNQRFHTTLHTQVNMADIYIFTFILLLSLKFSFFFFTFFIFLWNPFMCAGTHYIYTCILKYPFDLNQSIITVNVYVILLDVFCGFIKYF